MFETVLIANRGEIACRIIATCRRLGIRTVVAHSDTDRDSRAARIADAAINIGGQRAIESYLVAEKLVAAAEQSGADAVHPGYGFLSENAAFARALAARGIAFVGPAPETIALMGDKIAAKRAAARAGVPAVPGHDGALDDPQEALARAHEVGFPIMLKAAAGGGGRGMRVVEDADALAPALKAARREALAGFGDARLFMEKFIAGPHHIEVQVLADHFGHVVHLGERECSVQRRHQKIIEETPSPFLDDATRAALCAAAVTLARAVDYRSAGTVEFIVGADRRFYFLEMNTRLQVEHPVTEMVTGIDLVEHMLRVAAGEPLAITQADIQAHGWAIEARVYAEDPTRGFLPSTGRLSRHRPPPEAPGIVRVDGGFDEAEEIAAFYDPMIAKVIAKGDARGAAIGALRAALARYEIRGIANNLAFLGCLLESPAFRDGAYTTEIVERVFPEGFAAAPMSAPERARLALVAGALDVLGGGMDGGGAAADGDGWRARVALIDHVAHPLRVRRRAGRIEIACAGKRHVIQARWRPGETLFEGMIDDDPVCLQVDRAGCRARLIAGARAVDAMVVAPAVAELAARTPPKRAPAKSLFLRAPLPGLLVAVLVGPGQEVKAGEEIVIIEAMKMENVLRAEHDATVASVHVAAGDTVAPDQRLVGFTAAVTGAVTGAEA